MSVLQQREVCITVLLMQIVKTGVCLAKNIDDIGDSTGSTYGCDDIHYERRI